MHGCMSRGDHKRFQRGLQAAFVLCAASMAFCSAAQAAQGEECIATARVCVEPGETRWVDGIAVTRDCWSWRETYACLAPEDDSLNGCATLQKDAEASGPGRCELRSRSCSQEIAGTDGSTVCLAYKETWACDEKIELPPINAEWTKSTQETEESVDESQCGALIDRSDCSKGEVKCTEAGCERLFYCAAKQAQGCSALLAAGCTISKDPVCDEAIDATCSLKAGEAVCRGPLPEDVLQAEDAVIKDESTVNIGSPSPDVTSCVEMTAQKQAEGMQCTQIAQTCVDDEPAVRVINGVPYRASCWGYERVYRCERTVPASTCAGLEQSEGCKEVDRSCVKTDENGCAQERVVYNCGRIETVDPDEAQLIEKVDVITGIVEVDTCAELEDDAGCRKTAEVCTEPGSTKIIGGVPVTKDCWASEITYTCGSGTGEVTVDDGCAGLEERSDCRLSQSQCLGTDEEGRCTMLTKTFVCGGGLEEVVTGEVCDSQLCIAGVCEPAKPETSEDFVQGAAILEIIREAGVYGDVEGDMLFKGTASGCTTKMMGFSCCRSDVQSAAGTMSNSALSIGVRVGLDAGGELIKWLGSPYVYDILNEFESTQGVLQALYGTAGSGVYEPSLSYYGVSVGVSSTGSLTLEFSPMGFMAAVALEMAAEYFSCTNDDRMHALRKSRGLCHYVGSYCDKTSGAGCLEKKESWVCFNSRIARTVQEQGRKQLGIGWGTPQRPNARGFTLAEFQSLDFSKMDLSAVIAEVAEQAARDGTLGNLDLRREAVRARADERVRRISQTPDQYTALETITGRCFMGETGAAVSCTAVKALLSAYEAPDEANGSRLKSLVLQNALR